MQADNKAIRKRTQIDNTNRMMFIWVAGVSVVVGIAVVLIIFLFQMMLFNEKVLSEKAKTDSTLAHNISVTADLEKEISVLDTNQALIDTKASPDDRPIQVILDALPSEANSLALGASLQNKLLAGIDGLVIESMQVDPISGVESLSGVADNTVDASASTETSQGVITFKFSVKSAQVDAITKLLLNLEKSIRTINITNLKLEKQGADYVISAQGNAYYELAKTIELTDKVIKQ